MTWIALHHEQKSAIQSSLRKENRCTSVPCSRLKLKLRASSACGWCLNSNRWWITTTRWISQVKFCSLIPLSTPIEVGIFNGMKTYIELFSFLVLAQFNDNFMQLRLYSNHSDCKFNHYHGQTNGFGMWYLCHTIDMCSNSNWRCSRLWSMLWKIIGTHVWLSTMSIFRFE